MTNLIVAVSLLLTNSPVSVAPVASAAGSETVVQSRDVFPSASARLDPTWTDTALLLTVEGPAPNSGPTNEAAVIPMGVAASVTPIEAGMNRLAELGASPYELRVFGCLGWFESRNDPLAWSATSDAGLWQIHFPLHAWRFGGRDWRDPIANAEVAWDIYRESGWRAWTTHGLCGV